MSTRSAPPLRHALPLAYVVGLCALIPPSADAATLPVVSDTYLSAANPSRVHGAYEVLSVDASRAALLRFNSASLPSDVTARQIEKATLRIWLSSKTGGAVLDFVAPNGRWSEDDVTFNSAPSAGRTLETAKSVAAINNWVTVDVTDYVRDFIDNNTAGKALDVMVQLSATAARGSGVMFDSKENKVTSHAAWIDVVVSNSGATGPKGDTGVQGPIGPQGPVGAQGERGIPGPQGPDGVQGNTGPQGIRGATGPYPVISSGAGLTGSGTPDDPLSTDSSVLQRRVSSTCTLGAAIAAVNADGSVSCTAVVNAFPGSGLLTLAQGDTLNHWVGNPHLVWSRCYQRSSDGASASTFHSQCNNKGQTLTLLKLGNGKLIGGYAACSWLSSGNYRTECGGSFLFSLSNGHRYAMSNLSGNQPLYDRSSYGPTFGVGHDLYVDNSFSVGYCNPGYSYAQRKGSYGSSTAQVDFCGASYDGDGNSFQITDAEVWYINS